MQFDFRPIAEQYPKAFALLKEWISREENYDSSVREIHPDAGQIYTNSGERFNPLELDFFFDEQGVYGTLEFNQFSIAEGKRFGYEAATVLYNVDPEDNDIVGGSICGRLDIPSRAEALTALWIKEFSLLENKLNTTP